VQHLTCADCGDTATVETFRIDPTNQQLLSDVPTCATCAGPYLDGATDVIRLDDPTEIQPSQVRPAQAEPLQTELDLDLNELGA
jgi:NAD-dependent SIR2 family protein deacetylase